VFDRPWNADWKPDATAPAPVFRCTSWEQIACNAVSVLNDSEKQGEPHV
jgi:hypothetical protein